MKQSNFLRALFCTLILFNIFSLYTAGIAYADPKTDVKKSITTAPTKTTTNASGQNNDPLNPSFQESPVKYQGAEASIRQFLCVPGNGATDLSNCVNRLYRFGAAIGSFAAVFFIALAGYFYIVGGESGKSRAKTMIISVIAGLAIIFTSFIFLKQINPSLTEFRTIQPPQLTGVADDYQDCASLGLPAGCLIPDGEGGAAPSGRKGTAATCKGGLVDMPKDIPHGANAKKICKDLADKLELVAKALPPTGSVKWAISSTVRNWGLSRCHYDNGSHQIISSAGGSAVSGRGVENVTEGGNCADLVLSNGNAVDAAGYASLCKAIGGVSNLNFANEASHASECVSIKAYKSESTTTGANLHVNYLGP